jgi:hypothetical protein
VEVPGAPPSALCVYLGIIGAIYEQLALIVLVAGHTDVVVNKTEESGNYMYLII